MRATVVTKLKWLEAIAGDRSMPRLALAVAILIATRYLNNKTGRAWPGVDRLAQELRATRRNCQHALDRLVAAGWLLRERGGGRKLSNVYRLNSVTGDAVNAVNSVVGDPETAS